MQVLILTLVFSPDGVSTATIVSELSQDLQAKGHTLNVITTVPHYNIEQEARDKQPLQRHWGGLFYSSKYHGIPIWHTAIARKGQDVRGRMLSYLIFNFLSLVIGLFLVTRPDVILVVSPPLTSGIAGWLLAYVKRSRLIYNVQEMYPDTFIQTKTLRPESLTARILFWIEHFVYQHATTLTVICDAFRRAIVAKGISENKIQLIPNFVDIDTIQLGSKSNSLAEELDLTDKYVVLYAGNIGMTQSFDALLEAASRLQDESKIQFLIVGDGVRRTYVAEQIQELRLRNVILLPYQPRSRVSDIYATSDISLVPLMAGTARTTIPSKIYTIMASGRPVLASVDTDSDLVWIIEQAQCGLAIPPDDAYALAEAIRHAFNARDEFKVYGENGRRYVVAHFSRQAVTDQYHMLIQQLVNQQIQNTQESHE